MSEEFYKIGRAAASGIAGDSASQTIIADAIKDEISGALSGTYVSGRAAVLYVAPTGSDAAPGLTPATPKATLKAALAALPSGRGKVIALAGTHAVTNATAVTLDVSKASIVGEVGTVIDCSALTGSAVAITCTGSVNPPYRQSLRPLDTLELVGPGKASTTVGILWETTTGSGEGPSHTTCPQLNIHDFGAGVRYGQRAYCINLSGCDIWGNGTAIDSAGGISSDSGERLSFTGCTIFSNDLAVKAANSVGELVFFNCSLDYNAQTLDVDNSVVVLQACHVEQAAAATGRWLKAAGDAGVIQMVGGRLVCNGAIGSCAADYIVQNDAGYGGGVILTGVHITNTVTTTGDFSTGAGYTAIQSSTSPATAAVCRSVGVAANRLADGGAEAPTPLDEWFIASDTSAITSRTAGANCNITTDTAQHRSGSRAFKIAKTFGAGSACIASLYVPIAPGDKARARLWYAKPGSGTGTVYITFRYALIRLAGANALPQVAKYQDIGTATLSFTGAAVGWTETGTGEPTLRAPAWANAVLIEFSLDSFAGPDSLWIDDISVTTI